MALINNLIENNLILFILLVAVAVGFVATLVMLVVWAVEGAKYKKAVRNGTYVPPAEREGYGKKKEKKAKEVAPVEEKTEEAAPAPVEEKKEEPAPVVEVKEEPAPAPVEEKKEEPAPAPVKKEAPKAAPAAKKDAPKAAPARKTVAAKPAGEKPSGKWIIKAGENGGFIFELLASNSSKMIVSGEYSTLLGAKRGLETYKLNIAKNNFKIVRSKSGDFIFQLLNGNGQLLCIGADYKTKVRCESAIESTKRFAESASIEIEEPQA